MKRFSILFGVLMGTTCASAQVMWQVKRSSSQVWYLTQTDEFNDQKVNPDVWKAISSQHPYDVGLGVYYKADNLQYNRGFVSLQARQENTVKKIVPTPEDQTLMKNNNLLPDSQGEYTFPYSGAMLVSKALYGPGYFEMRFRISDEQGTWPSLRLSNGNGGESIALLSANGGQASDVYMGVPCVAGCTDVTSMYSRKGFGGFTRLSEPFSKDWNIISAEWGSDYITYFVNGTPVAYYKGIVTAGKELILSHTVSKKGYGLKKGPNKNTNFPAGFDVDYVRMWGKQDTSGYYKDRYELFENSGLTIDNRLLYSGDVKKKDKAISRATELSDELGTITVLPVLYNKYSVSIEGSALATVQIDVVDRFNEKVAGFALSNVSYYIMDLGALPTGPYKVKITVLGQVLEHDIPVINPEKVGEQRDGK